MFTIYSLEHRETGYRYVGSTKDFEQRIYNHFNRMLHGTHSNSRMQAAYNETGRGSFDYTILETTEDEAERFKLEQRYMDELEPEFNILPVAGSAKGRKYTDETLAKMSETASKRVMSEEQKEKLRTLRTGATTSEETKRKQSEARKEYWRKKKEVHDG